MCIVLIFRETALGVILLKCYARHSQITIPTTILRCQAAEVTTQHIKGLAITLLITETIGVAELQVGTTPNWLAVACAGTIAIVRRRCDIPAVCLIRGVGCHQFNDIVRKRLAVTLTVVTVQHQGKVAARIVQLSVNLQHTANVLRIAVANAVRFLIVLNYILVNQTNLCQGVSNQTY